MVPCIEGSLYRTPPFNEFSGKLPNCSLLRSRYSNVTLICVGCSVHYWMFCAINKGGCFEIAFVVVVVVDTRLPRFEALAYVLSHFDALTHLVIRVSSVFIFQTFAEVCSSVFANRSSFKSVLNFRKAHIFKSSRRSTIDLCLMNLPIHLSKVC